MVTPIFVLLLIIATVITLFTAPIFNIKTVKIVGNNKIDENTIATTSNILVGGNIFRTNFSSAKKRIKNLEYIEKVKIKRHLPSTVEIKVTEGTVKYYIEENENLIGISASGIVVINTDYNNMPSICPIIRGVSIKSKKIGDSVKSNDKDKFSSMNSLISLFDAVELFEAISIMDLTFFDEIDFTYNNKMLVEMGSTDNASAKINVFKDMLENQIGYEASGYLNIKNPEKVIYRESID